MQVLQSGGELVGGLGEGGGDVFVGVGAAGVAEEVADGGDGLVVDFGRSINERTGCLEAILDAADGGSPKAGTV